MDDFSGGGKTLKSFEYPFDNFLEDFRQFAEFISDNRRQEWLSSMNDGVRSALANLRAIFDFMESRCADEETRSYRTGMFVTMWQYVAACKERQNAEQGALGVLSGAEATRLDQHFLRAVHHYFTVVGMKAMNGFPTVEDVARLAACFKSGEDMEVPFHSTNEEVRPALPHHVPDPGTWEWSEPRVEVPMEKFIYAMATDQSEYLYDSLDFDVFDCIRSIEFESAWDAMAVAIGKADRALFRRDLRTGMVIKASKTELEGALLFLLSRIEELKDRISVEYGYTIPFGGPIYDSPSWQGCASGIQTVEFGPQTSIETGLGLCQLNIPSKTPGKGMIHVDLRDRVAIVDATVGEIKFARRRCDVNRVIEKLNALLGFIQTHGGDHVDLLCEDVKLQ